MALSKYEIAILEKKISETVVNFHKSSEANGEILRRITGMLMNPDALLSSSINEERPAELSKPTIGEARQKIIELLDLHISKETKKLRISNSRISWDADEFKEMVSKMSGNEVEIVPLESVEKSFKNSLELIESILRGNQEIESLTQDIQQSIEERRQTGGETAVLNNGLERTKSETESVQKSSVNGLLIHVNNVMQDIQKVIEERQKTGGETVALNNHLEFGQSLKEEIQGLNRGNFEQFSNVQNKGRKSEKSNALEKRKTCTDTSDKIRKTRRL